MLMLNNMLAQPVICTDLSVVISPCGELISIAGYSFDIDTTIFCLVTCPSFPVASTVNVLFPLPNLLVST
jgi:hypothetical protein